MGKGLKVIHQDCDASLSEDKTLPYNAFLVEYIEGEATKFDIVSACLLYTSPSPRDQRG